MRILLAIPHNFTHFEVMFSMGIFAIQDYFFEWIIKNKRDDTLSIVRQSGYQLDEMRNSLVDVAIKHKMTHILFLDTDMFHPKDMIVRMIEDFEDNKEVSAITGLYVRKSPPYLPHIYPKFLKKEKTFGISGLFPLNSIFKVEGAGLGCLMIKTDVFKRIKKPYFKMGGEIDGKKGYGEDLYFFLKAKPLTLCDTRLMCSHFKPVGFTIDDYIKSNKLKIKGNQVEGTKEQINEIAKKYKKN